MAVTTAGDLITKSLKELLVLGVQNTPSAVEMADGLDVLNLMLEQWEIQSLACFGLQQENFPLVSGQASYTIGPTGNFVTARPQSITGGYTLLSGVSYRFTVINRDSYDAIPYKSNGGIPSVLFYDPTMPDGTIYLYLVPSPVPMQLYIDSYRQIQSFANLTTQISLPKGYKYALIKNLAVAQAAQYGVEPSATLVKEAAQSLAWLKRLNRNQQDNVAFFDAMILANRTYNPWGDTWV